MASTCPSTMVAMPGEAFDIFLKQNRAATMVLLVDESSWMIWAEAELPGLVFSVAMRIALRRSFEKKTKALKSIKNRTGKKKSNVSGERRRHE